MARKKNKMCTVLNFDGSFDFTVILWPTVHIVKYILLLLIKSKLLCILSRGLCSQSFSWFFLSFFQQVALLLQLRAVLYFYTSWRHCQWYRKITWCSGIIRFSSLFNVKKQHLKYNWCYSSSSWRSLSHLSWIEIRGANLNLISFNQLTKDAVKRLTWATTSVNHGPTAPAATW